DTVAGGWARLAAKIKEIRTAKTGAGNAVLLVDSGDFTMGTVYDLLWNTDPAPLRFINSMQYDLITWGNHEFDYGPEKLATMINRARAATGGFTVPIIATNTVFDGIAGTADDGLEALKNAGVIINDYYVKTCANGLKVGVIGLMGRQADAYSPNAPPVSFKSDYVNDAVKTFIQGKVNTLRNTLGVHVVIALSHSGIIDPNGTPSGDDVILAQNITGIDIILSGHEHAKTNAVVPVVNGNHTSYIICAGVNGTNLAQLDFTVNLTQRKISTTPILTNHAINDTIMGDAGINTLVQTMNASINNMLNPLGTSLSSVVATSDITLGEPPMIQEFGLGNLLADAVRYVGTENGIPTIGTFANGVIRDTIRKDQVMSFADLFAVTPMGMTTDDTQNPLLPGYPLLKIYVDGNEVWDLCKFDATIMAFQAYPAYYVSLSGLKCTFSGTTVNDAAFYAWNDYTSTGPATTIPKGMGALYPVIIDKYTMDMILSDEIQFLLALVGVSLQPKLSDGTVIDRNNLLSARLDRDAAAAGAQEYSAWMATLKFFTDTGALNGTIPAVPYDLSTKRMIAQ
ncbi:MAG: metallophosphoesterase, partial [Deltaproteobacteria bacterium]|nr:metallophosphoesterase [Deltaproteobacteria bacterium]